MAEGIKVGSEETLYSVDELSMLVYMQSESRGAGEYYITSLKDVNSRKGTKDEGFGHIDKSVMKSYILKINKEACQDNVTESYIKDTAINNPILMIMGKLVKKTTTEETRRGIVTKTVTDIDPIGFICANYQYDESRPGFYIDVICSKYHGTHLLNYFINFAKKYGKTYVGLSSLPSVLSYYPRQGFEFRKTCVGEPLAVLPASITEYLASKNSSGERIKPPKTGKNAYDIDPYLEFMHELHGKGLSVHSETDACKNLAISKGDIKKFDCGQDGYSMKRCNLGEATAASGAGKVGEATAASGAGKVGGATRRRRKSNRRTRRHRR